MLSDYYLQKKRARQRPENEQPDPFLWMLTFSDLLMLVLGMFVLRLSMSSFRGTAVTELSSSVRAIAQTSGQLSKPPTQATLVERPKDDSRVWLQSLHLGFAQAQQMEVVANSLQNTYGNPTLNAHGSIANFGDELLVTYSDGTLTASLLGGSFAENSDELTFKASVAISTIAKSFQGQDFEINIAGYEDPAEQFGGAVWDLANNRTLAVLRQMLDAGVDGRMLSVSNYGSQERSDSGEDSLNKARRSRIDITIKIKLPENFGTN